ncbi:alpha/beta fold hydrolase [Muricauda sp. JGD-17]|uniref:Alpha/beta fold hydrolase n=1 Tax=Flagellimonas ochracea TaxID=2696472 RepID=A0A964TAF0_9FLAO|nr:alpha/beta fold hydrolase [Allomuricauda ochracea]NAY90453.1 alpha/beta fold hydrolase [Allomuricauda ochracea]
MKSKAFHTITIFFCIALFFFPRLTASQESDSIIMSPIKSEAFKVMNHFFDYDKSIPLGARTVEKNEDINYIREKIVFEGIANSRVPGYLGIPKKGNGPYKCVLVLHGVGDSKESWWKENSFNSGRLLTERLIDSGFAVLSLDAEYHGERMLNNDYESADVFIFQKGWVMRARDMIVQTVIEYRRAMDYLATREEIDSTGFGAIGYSMGGMMVFNLSAVDSRLNTAVASVTPVLKEPFSALAVYNFAPFVKTSSFLMLMGESDNRNYSKTDGQKLYDLLKSKNKEIKWFDSGHKLPDEWTTSAATWISKYLK